MSNAVVNVNGTISRPEEAKVGVFDRAYLYGDSLYEVVRSYHGVFLHMEEHLDRLEKSARLCRMVLTQTPETYRREMYRTFAAFRKLAGMKDRDAYCRIIVSRGEGKIGFGLNCLTTPTLFSIIVQPLDPPSASQFEKGLKLRVSGRMRNDRRALDPAMKSGNYLNSLLAFLECADEDFDDALLCNADDHLTEGTTYNIGYVRNGIIATPPIDIGILDGITRREMIAMARENGIEVREARFPKERLYEADEVFVTSTIKEIFPVTRVDDRMIHGGKPGPLTRKLREAFQKRVAALAAQETRRLSALGPASDRELHA